MIQATSSVAQAGSDVLGLEVRVFLEDLLLPFARREKIQNVGHPDPQTADARATSALIRIEGDPMKKLVSHRNH